MDEEKGDKGYTTDTSVSYVFVYKYTDTFIHLYSETKRGMSHDTDSAYISETRTR